MAAQNPTQDDLGQLATVQNQAVASGDPVAIAATTEPYLRALLLRDADIELSLDEGAKAVRAYEAAALVTRDSETRLKLGILLLQHGQPRAALDQLKVVTGNNDEQRALVWTAKGMAYRALEENQSAVDSFRHALEISSDVRVAYALGSVYLLLHEEQKAADLFERIFSVEKGVAIWHVAAGDAYREARYYKQAVAEFEKAISLDPRALHAEFFLGLTYLQMNEWGPNSATFEHFRRAVAQSPHEYVSNFYLGALESTDGTDIESSDKHLDAAAKADPSQPEVWIYLGLNANRQHRIEVAERDLRKAIELTGTDESRNNYQVRRAYFALGRLLISNGKKEEGAALLQKYRQAEQASVAASGAKIASMSNNGDLADVATKAQPQNSDTSLALVVAPSESQKNVAKPLLTQESVAIIASLESTIAAAFNDLGTSLARQQKYAEALPIFLAGEKWGSPDPALLRNIGFAAFRVEDFAQASRALLLYEDASRKVGPNWKSSPAVQRALLLLGLSLFHEGQFAKAAQAFAEVPTVTSSDPRAEYSYAFSLSRTGHALEAKAIADSLQRQQLPSEQLSLVCHLYLDNEDYEGALSCYRGAYGKDPTLQLAHYEASQALVHLDRANEAIVELSEERKLSPGNPNVEYAMAYALLQASKKEEALALLEKVTSEYPELAEAQYQLGKLLLEQGRAADAVSHLEASEKANASPDYVHYQLGLAYKKAGRQQDAERELKLYREIKEKKRDAASASVPQAHEGEPHGKSD